MTQKVTIAGKKVHPIGIGTWNIGNHTIDRDKEITAIQRGIEAGAQVIDTAEMYGNGLSEQLVGEAIRHFSRESLYLISKILPENASKKQLPQSLEKSLQRLAVDYLDLYLLHWQGAVPIEDTIEAMEKAKKAGKIRAWGVSNFDTKDLQKMTPLPHGQECVANQVKYNLFDRGIEYDLLPYMQKQQIMMIAYSPIVKGDFSGINRQQKKVLQEIVERHQISIPQLFLAWSIRDNHTIAIPKASKVEHMLENLQAGDISLTQQEYAQIDQVFCKPTSKQSLALW
jgi:diketogulonate reductase-like aldo/keto reductase